jgi:hypothetical protein
MTVIQFATNHQPTKPVRACTTCRHRQAHREYAYYDKCTAVGNFTNRARDEECNHGILWEPMLPPPPFVPVLVRLKRWLIG